jgi:acetyl-CoA carboxylase biotin carboxyl carrier protein
MGDKKHGIDRDLIRDLAALLKETDLSEIEIEQGDFRIRVARGTAAAPTVMVAPHELPAAPPASQQGQPEKAATGAPLTDPARHPGCVPSPMVGTAYRAAEPGAAPFVEVGSTVRAGQTILIVEAMKHMNEVAAPRAGKVVEILVEDGQPVEYGEPLMIIE